MSDPVNPVAEDTMNPWWASAGAAVALRGRRTDDDEDLEGLTEFDEDEEFDDEDLEDGELDDEEGEDEDAEEGYDDLDEDFDDDGEPRRGGGRPRREWTE